MSRKTFENPRDMPQSPKLLETRLPPSPKSWSLRQDTPEFSSIRTSYEPEPQMEVQKIEMLDVDCSKNYTDPCEKFKSYQAITSSQKQTSSSCSLQTPSTISSRKIPTPFTTSKDRHDAQVKIGAKRRIGQPQVKEDWGSVPTHIGGVKFSYAARARMQIRRNKVKADNKTRQKAEKKAEKPERNPIKDEEKHKPKHKNTKKVKKHLPLTEEQHPEINLEELNNEVTRTTKCIKQRFEKQANALKPAPETKLCHLNKEEVNFEFKLEEVKATPLAIIKADEAEQCKAAEESAKQNNNLTNQSIEENKEEFPDETLNYVMKWEKPLEEWKHYHKNYFQKLKWAEQCRPENSLVDLFEKDFIEKGKEDIINVGLPSSPQVLVEQQPDEVVQYPKEVGQYPEEDCEDVGEASEEDVNLLEKIDQIYRSPELVPIEQCPDENNVEAALLATIETEEAAQHNADEEATKLYSNLKNQYFEENRETFPEETLDYDMKWEQQSEEWGQHHENNFPKRKEVEQSHPEIYRSPKLVPIVQCPDETIGEATLPANIEAAEPVQRKAAEEGAKLDNNLTNQYIEENRETIPEETLDCDMKLELPFKEWKQYDENNFPKRKEVEDCHPENLLVGLFEKDFFEKEKEASDNLGLTSSLQALFEELSEEVQYPEEVAQYPEDVGEASEKNVYFLDKIDHIYRSSQLAPIEQCPDENIVDATSLATTEVEEAAQYKTAEESAKLDNNHKNQSIEENRKIS